MTGDERRQVDRRDCAFDAVVDRHRDGQQTFLELLVNDRVAVGACTRNPLAELALSVTVAGWNRSSVAEARYDSRSSSGRPASSTRPIEVAWAGIREPMLTAIVISLVPGTRVT